jgi:hypothetical protein
MGRGSLERLPHEDCREEWMTQNSDSPEPGKANRVKVGAGLAIGMALGLALGAAMNNIGAGVAIGIALGVAFSTSMGRNQEGGSPKT